MEWIVRLEIPPVGAVGTTALRYGLNELRHCCSQRLKSSSDISIKYELYYQAMKHSELPMSCDSPKALQWLVQSTETEHSGLMSVNWAADSTTQEFFQSLLIDWHIRLTSRLMEASYVRRKGRVGEVTIARFRNVNGQSHQFIHHKLLPLKRTSSPLLSTIFTRGNLPRHLVALSVITDFRKRTYLLGSDQCTGRGILVVPILGFERMFIRHIQAEIDQVWLDTWSFEDTSRLCQFYYTRRWKIVL